MEDDVQDIQIAAAPQWVASALIGPCMIGYQVGLLFFGVFLNAFCSYAASGELGRLGRPAKAALWLVLFLNLLYIGISFQETYDSGVNNNRTIDFLLVGSLQWQFFPWLNGMIAAVVEVFLAVRAASFIPHRTAKIVFLCWVGALVVLVIFGSTVVFAEGVILFYRGEEDDASLAIAWNTGVAIWLWASAVCDLTISFALAFSLRKRIAGFNAGTDSLLRSLATLALRTASYTSLLSIVGAVVASVYDDDTLKTTEINIAFWFPLGPLYGISLLTTTSSSRRILNNHLGSGNAFQPSQRPSNTADPLQPPTQMRDVRPISLHLASQVRSFSGGDAADGRKGNAAHVPLRVTVKQEVRSEVDDGADYLEATGSAGEESGVSTSSALGRRKEEWEV
ncbi:hypothetical protein JCM10213v2_000182 [Rhodosporidiobolus nylandii]